MTERLQKILSANGICSRRAAEKLIISGCVKVNGFTAELGESADEQRDIIEVNGKVLPKKRCCVYIMLNKPRGYVTTLSDESGRADVSALVKDVGRRVFPVGRLDRHSEGLLLLTDDGDFSYALTHPKHQIYKEYLVKITIKTGDFTNNPDRELSKITMLDGIPVAPARCRIVERNENRYTLSISIREGKNRQIRRMCASLGYTVNSLKRVAVGGVKLGSLPAGQWRELTADEVNHLKTAAKRMTE